MIAHDRSKVRQLFVDLSFCFVLFCNETKITATKIDQNNEEYKKCLNLN